MDTEKRFDLITRSLEEVLTPEELRTLLTQGVPLKHYIGFEISGRVHLGTGFATGFKIADFQKAGVKCSCYLATWHAWINNKFGGDLDIIRKASRYFRTLLELSIDAAGGDSSKVSFIDGDQLYHHNDDFWRTVIEITKQTTVNRAMRSISIMGRKEGSDVPLASLVYAPMQAADIFTQGINLAHAGMDQRKAHIIAREVALKLTTSPLMLNKKPYKPLALHHHLLKGLNKPTVWPPQADALQEELSDMKMSKSIPGSAVFVDDSEEVIRKNLIGAFCPPDHPEHNPLLDWAKYLVFNREKSSLKIQREKKFGGDVEYSTYADLLKDYQSQKLHPMDLKKGMAEYLIKLLAPIRSAVKKPALAKLKTEFDQLRVTR
jgi:tyrosyl-tRNA synthetase